MVGVVVVAVVVVDVEGYELLVLLATYGRKLRAEA